MNVENLRGKLLLSLLLGVLVYVGLSFYADFKDLATSFEEFRWELLPLILALTSFNYVLRFIKWEFYLAQIGVRGLSKWNSLLIYYSGLGMVVTPGKVGEWLKSYLLREVHGTPAARSAPILIAERLTDSIALLILASLGVVIFRNLWPVVAVVAVGSVLLVFAARHRGFAAWFMALGERVPLVNRFVPHFQEFYESSYTLMAPWSVLLMTGLSITSWFFEVAAMFVTFLGLGLDPSLDLLLKSAFILPIATLAAAILFTPGGLGVAEGGITGLSQSLLDLPASAAAVATLVIRFGTLWFGVIVGLAAFAILGRRMSRASAVAIEPGTPAEAVPDG